MCRSRPRLRRANTAVLWVERRGPTARIRRCNLFASVAFAHHSDLLFALALALATSTFFTLVFSSICKCICSPLFTICKCLLFANFERLYLQLYLLTTLYYLQMFTICNLRTSVFASVFAKSEIEEQIQTFADSSDPYFQHYFKLANKVANTSAPVWDPRSVGDRGPPAKPDHVTLHGTRVDLKIRERLFH